MRYKTLWWRLPLSLTGIVIGAVLLLLIAATCVLYVPSVRNAVIDKGIVIASEQTGWDIELGQIDVSLFHHSPLLCYRAYTGTEDLPLTIRIDSLFIGHRGQDTLVCTQSLRLQTTLRTSVRPLLPFTACPLTNSRLSTSDFQLSLPLPAVGVNVLVGQLELFSPEFVLEDGYYPLHGLRLADAFVGIDLHTPPDTAARDTTPLRLAFEVQDGELNNVRFALTPLGLHIQTRRLATNVLVDVGNNRFDARRLDIGDASLTLNRLYLPFDTLYGNACVDLNRHLITSQGLHARSDELGAKADLAATSLQLNTLRVDVTGEADFKGSKAQLKGYYDIDDEAYNLHAQVEKVNLSPFLKDSTRVVIAGEIEAEGKGILPQRPLVARVQMRLDDALYGPYDFSHTTLNGSTDSVTSLALTMPGLQTDLHSPMPLFTLIDRILPLVNTVSDTAVIQALTSLKDLTVLDTIREQIPPLSADIALRRGSPIQAVFDSAGIGFDQVELSLRSDSQQTTIHLPLSTFHLPDTFRLPSVQASLEIEMTEGQTYASLTADTRLTDGAMTFYDLCTDAAFRMNLRREGHDLYGNGQLRLDSIYYTNKDLGSHDIDVQIAPSSLYNNALHAEISLEDIPIELVKSFVTLEDIELEGAVRASATVDGLPFQTDISAEVRPLGVKAEYKPYQVTARLGQTPIVMHHNKVNLNNLPVYGVDSTFIALNGGLDLNQMRLDVTLSADSFAPAKLPRGGPFPVYGELATDIRGTVTGPLDSIMADIDVTILPVTDITYPIDQKNLAQVKPHGTVKLLFHRADEQPLTLGGQLNVDDGVIRYSPKAYPIMPFHVDSGSHVAFRGPLGQTLLDISASQQVKADVQSEDEESRRVQFTTGVRVNGELDSIGLHAIGFFLEAPEDETITQELASLDEEDREGLAATLLATGMYVGESNVAAQRGGYALSSIINSRLNAAMANSKMGKFVDIDLSSARTEHVGGQTNDLNIAISKSFFQDRLKLTIGSTLTDNPEVNQTSGLLSSLSADYKLTKEGNVSLRAFTQRDYNNILEGDLYKSGLGVRATKDWRRQEQYRGDSIHRTYGLTADADIAWRSNNSLGPNLTLTSSIRNLMGQNETFTVKGNGAYYWALRNRHPGDPQKTDTYKFGANASLIFPYLHWATSDNPEGDTRYLLGYQYENIAGGYGVHKVSGSFTYFIRSPFSPYITHAFTPFSLSVVRLKVESDSLLDKAAEYPQLIKVLAGNEFVPAVAYTFTYNDYRAKRAVNTMLELGIKESGNLINALYCLFGYSWNDTNKPLGSITFNQFVKMTAELRNRFNITDRVCIATRLFAGANMPLGNSLEAPLSEAFYAGGPNGMRAAAPYAYGAGNFYSEKYNQNFFHAGDIKLEANFELRFPILWKLFGAAFVDAGNVWNWYSGKDLFLAAGITDYVERLQLRGDLYDGIVNNPDFLRQIALGTGAGLRLDLDGLVVRLDLGYAIHAPYRTYRYDKNWNTDFQAPITDYYNIPSALDALRLNFGIGYPF